MHVHVRVRVHVCMCVQTDGSGDISFAEVNRMVRGIKAAKKAEARAAKAKGAAASDGSRDPSGGGRRSPSPPPVYPVELEPLRDELYAELAIEAEKWAAQADMDQDLYGDIIAELSTPLQLRGAVDDDAATDAAGAPTGSYTGRSTPPPLVKGVGTQRKSMKRISVKAVAKSAAPLSELRRMMVANRDKPMDDDE